MSNSYGFGGEEIREESSWRYPLAIFFATLILCAIFLYHYVGPGVDEIQGATPKPTISEEKIRMTIGERVFAIPANYTIYPKDRRNGEKDRVDIYLVWPTMNGYSPARRAEFVENTPRSRRIDVTIGERRSVFSEEQRLESLYLPHVIDKTGQPDNYQLTRFTFKEGRTNAPTNGYNNKDLFVGTADDGSTLVLFCYQKVFNEIPPECWRELELSENVSIKYTFKREYLPEWKEIDTQVRRFLFGLIENPTG
jgi:hypothetical protein